MTVAPMPQAIPSELPAPPVSSEAMVDAIPTQDSPQIRAAENTVVANPKTDPSRLSDALLRIFADALDDLERTRIATENRVRALLAEGMTAEMPEVIRLMELKDAIAVLEHTSELNLKRALRAHPLGPWVQATIDIGEKQGARLLAAIGDPAWNDAEQRPRRGPAELWAYCGFHVVAPGQLPRDTQQSCAGGDAHVGTDAQSTAGVAPSRRRGEHANWNGEARMRAFLVAESCMKAKASPYRLVYDEGRAKYVEAVHANPCVRCGPSKSPAQVGSPLSDGHKHARALRLAAKAILRDLFLVARDHRTLDIQTCGVTGNLFSNGAQAHCEDVDVAAELL